MFELSQCHYWPGATATGRRRNPKFAFHSLDEILNTLREKFTPNGHFQLVKGILQRTIRIQNIDFSKDLSQIDRSRRLWFRRNDKLDPRSCLQALEGHAIGLDFFDSVVGARLFVARKFQGGSLGGNRVQGVKGRSDTEPFVGANLGRLGAECSVVNEPSGLVDDEQMEEHCCDIVCDFRRSCCCSGSCHMFSFHSLSKNYSALLWRHTWLCALRGGLSS